MTKEQSKEIVDSYLKSVECMNLMQSKEWIFDDTKLYSSQMHTIRAIGNTGEINLTDLANKMGITKAGASKFVAKLQDCGFVEKFQSATNRKEVYFTLTSKGIMAYEEHEAFSYKTFAQIYEMMDNMSQEELVNAEKFMKKLALILEGASK